MGGATWPKRCALQNSLLVFREKELALVTQQELAMMLKALQQGHVGARNLICLPEFMMFFCKVFQPRFVLKETTSLD